MSEYLRAAFPLVTTMRITIDPRFMLPYAHSAGALLALDMLFGMPRRTKLIRAAASAASVQAIQSGLSQGWDNKIDLFKTVFRYLPGTASGQHNPQPILPTVSNLTNFAVTPKNTASAVNIQAKHPSHAAMSYRNASITNLAAMVQAEAAENIVDDVSVALHLDSHESCPYYRDDYSALAYYYQCMEEGLMEACEEDNTDEKNSLYSACNAAYTLRNTANNHLLGLSPILLVA